MFWPGIFFYVYNWSILVEVENDLLNKNVVSHLPAKPNLYLICEPAHPEFWIGEQYKSCNKITRSVLPGRRININ